MARIVGGSPMGELSGKMGGFVFSRNRSGQYVRKFSIPINPSTGAQLQARSSFAGAVGSFHSLTPAEKSQWQSFAVGAFNPKNAINIGQFSGINAYTALRQLVIHGNKLLATKTMSVNGVALVTQPTDDPLVFNDIPPVYTVQPNLKEATTGNSITYGDITGGVKVDGSFNFTMNINPGLTGPPNLQGLVDAVDHPIGYAVYMSEPHPQAGLFYKNPFNTLLGVIPGNDADSTDLTAVTSIGFSTPAVVDPSNFQNWPVVDDWVRVSVYAIDVSHGTLMCIGTLQTSPGVLEVKIGSL